MPRIKKYLLFLLIAGTLLSACGSNGSYQQGYDEGYSAGYAHAKAEFESVPIGEACPFMGTWVGDSQNEEEYLFISEDGVFYKLYLVPNPSDDFTTYRVTSGRRGYIDGDAVIYETRNSYDSEVYTKISDVQSSDFTDTAPAMESISLKNENTLMLNTGSIYLRVNEKSLIGLDTDDL